MTIPISLKELLIEHGFCQSTPPNVFTRGKKYTATVWRTGAITITRRTSIYGRYLYEVTCENKDSLEKELKKIIINQAT